jgi:hypothetical protein
MKINGFDSATVQKLESGSGSLTPDTTNPQGLGPKTRRCQGFYFGSFSFLSDRFNLEGVSHRLGFEAWMVV